VERSVRGLILRSHPIICLEGLWKTTKNLSQNSRCPGRYLNPGPTEYEAGVPATGPRRSVMKCTSSCLCAGTDSRATNEDTDIMLRNVA
jgi:hypothetical protein